MTKHKHVCVCVCVYVYFLFVLSSGLLISLTQLMLTECPLHGVPRLGKAADRKQNEIHFQSCSPEGRQMFEPWLGHTEYPMPLDIVRNQCLFQPWSVFPQDFRYGDWETSLSIEVKDWLNASLDMSGGHTHSMWPGGCQLEVAKDEDNS